MGSYELIYDKFYNNADSSAIITRANDVTAYTIGDVVSTTPTATVMEFTNIIGNTDSREFLVCGASLRIDASAVPSGMSGFRLHLYNASPTAILDNAPFNLPSGDRSKYLGYIELSTPIDIGDTIYSQSDNINFRRKIANGTSVYGILETLGAYTPTASITKTITLHTIGV